MNISYTREAQCLNMSSPGKTAFCRSNCHKSRCVQGHPSCQTDTLRGVITNWQGKKRIPGEGHKDQGGIPRTYAERKSSVNAAGEAMHHRTVGHLL